MKPMTFEETKKVELDILKNVADFCDKNNILYFLAYGTLIGAIRHKGFIPWDDDIDIWMPREDYNKFLKTYNNSTTNPTYRAISPEEKVSRHSFAKVVNVKTAKVENGIDYSNGYLGVDIDVFPLDGQPSDDEEFLKWYDQLQKQYKRFQYTVMGNNRSVKRRLFLPIVKILIGKKSYMLKKASLLHEKYPYKTSEYIGAVESRFNFKSNRYKKDWFKDAVDVEFENEKFKVPIGYHEILTAMYGDYMKLPPKEKQITHHENNTYWLED